MPRFRPRISLSSALLLMTIAGMAIVVVQLWREVSPLREEVRRQREELGYLTIDDPAKAYAISVNSLQKDEWMWRLHLPSGRQHTLNCYSGILPSSPNYDREFNKRCFAEAKRTGKTNSGTIEGGQLTLQANLVKDGNRWEFRMPSIGRMSHPQWSGDWLSNRGSWQLSSDLDVKGQSEFEAGDPILLLRIAEPVSDRPVDSVMLWIE